MTTHQNAVSVFLSYAHEDEPLLRKLETHLSLLKRQGLISTWYDRLIVPGTNWAEAIDQQLEQASLILLLVSADFLASDYCYDIEMRRSLEREQQGKTRVIPLILRPCDWKTAPFAYLQALPRDGKPVITWQEQDEAWLAIMRGIRQVCESLAGTALSVSRFSSLDRRNRMFLLKRVRAIWVEGVLKHSLHQAALLALDLQERPDALANPWRYEVQETNLPPKLRPTGTSIAQIYQEAEGALLIMGEPGAGKSTLLYELAHTLLEQAAQNERLPIPVVFNLSSWALEKRELAEWLVEELRLKYRVSRSLGKAWIEDDRILPLLDGLDEVEKNDRPACVQAINSYSQQHLGKPLVTCCRTAEYYAQETRAWLNKAVEVQPLTNQQVEQYLDSAGGKLEGVRKLIKRDADMRELARTPLILSILALTYHDATPKLPGAGPLKMRRRQIFATYVQQMLSRRGQPKSGNAEQIIYWLTWLALQMEQQQPKFEEFYLERLQPTWLATRRARVIYTVLKTLLIALVVGLGSGLLFALIFGLGAVLFSPVPSGLPFELRLALGFALVNGLILGPFVGLGGLRKLRSLLGRPQIQEIQASDKLTWSWKPFWGTLVIALPIALGLGFLGGRVVTLVVALLAALLIALGIGLLRGLSDVQIDKHMRLRPNQGIRNSGWNALWSGLLGGVLAGLLIGLGLGLGYALFSGSVVLGGLFGAGLGLGLGLGMLVGLAYGGEAYLAHYTLRLVLWRGQHLPRDLAAFLDEAAQRLLLRKAGGGYSFIHRLLLDYFASLEKKEP